MRLSYKRLALTTLLTALSIQAPLSAAEAIQATAATEPGPGIRNVALNSSPAEQAYPRASSNSEYNRLDYFSAMCAINGNTDSKGHGPAFPSWGPHIRDDLWFRIDFGKTVEIEKIVIFVRADFTPYTAGDHDSFWKTGRIEFSDGSEITYELSRTADGQEIKFPKRSVEWINITDLVPNRPIWCAFTEVQVWGK